MHFVLKELLFMVNFKSVIPWFTTSVLAVAASTAVDPEKENRLPIYKLSICSLSTLLHSVLLDINNLDFILTYIEFMVAQD